MAYNISLTNNTALTTVSDGTYDNTTTSLTLIGKNFPSYGTFLNENFIYLLENFANSNAPLSPLAGQLWWDSTNAILKVNAATVRGDLNAKWKSLACSSASPNAPSPAIAGDMWWDSGNSQLKVYSGSTWVVIGPQFTATTGQSGAIADVINGTDQQAHIVVKFYVNNVLVSILSKDATFTPVDLVAGGLANKFPVIKPGLNFSNQTNPSLLYWGDANQALNLKLADGTILPASVFVRSDITVPVASKQQILTDDGIDIGATIQASLNINQPTNEFRIISNKVGNDIKGYVSLASKADTLALTISGTNGLITVKGDPTTSLGIATKNYVDTANVAVTNALSSRIASNIATVLARDGSTTITGNLNVGTNNLYSLGTSSTKFANVWATTFRGTSVNAQYADLAEMYTTDQNYEIGTVVVAGGDAELTASMCNQIAVGVISDKPAFLMNEKSPGQPIALKGRVKVKVNGVVKKGDGLTAGDFGTAITSYDAANSPDASTGLLLQRVFAVSLETSDNPDTKLIECIIL